MRFRLLPWHFAALALLGMAVAFAAGTRFGPPRYVFEPLRHGPADVGPEPELVPPVESTIRHSTWMDPRAGGELK